MYPIHNDGSTRQANQVSMQFTEGVRTDIELSEIDMKMEKPRP
jgi:hypothetical protein